MRLRRPILPILLTLLICTGPLRAELRCEKPAIDLGEIHGGPARSHRFEFVNVSTTPVEIVDVQRSCGCLEPTIDRRTVGPGERAGITFQVRTLGQANGPRTWRATVRWRQGDDTRETGLTIAGTVVNEVTVEPAVLALYVEKGLRQEVRVRDTRTPPLKVTTVQATVPALEATVRPTADGAVIVLDVTRLEAGRHDAALNIYTDDPHYRHLQVPVTLLRGDRPAVTATPAMVSGPSALVRLRAADGRTVVIESAGSDAPGITATWAAGPGNDVTLRVTVQRDRLANADGPHSVRLQLAEPVREVITIPVDGLQ